MRQFLFDFPLPPQEEPLAVVNEVEISYRPRGFRPNKALNEPEDIVELLKPFLAYRPDQEKMWVIPVDARNRPKGVFLSTLGTANQTLVKAPEVYRVAVAVGARALIVAHNHPSGDPLPSAADIRVTRTLREAGNLLEIHLHDHIVVGSPEHDPNGLGFYSFRAGGHL